MFQICTCFSQVTPNPDNYAANALSTANQTRNIRSVEVNSKVAMIIWAIECVANLNLILIEAFSVDGLSTLTIIIAWFYVIIPFMFLMNTSFNKERVVENGWKAVLISPFVRIHSYFLQPTAFELRQILGNGPKDETANPIIGVSSNSKNSDGTNKESVFIISNKKLDKSQIKVDTDLKVEDIEAIPSTSMHKNNTNSELHLKRLHAKRLSSDSEPENYTKSYRLRIGENILRNMVKQTNNENSYLHYFYQLLEFENMLKNKPLDQRIEFEITPFPKYNKQNVPIVKSSISQIQQSQEKKKNNIRNKSHSQKYESLAREPQMPVLTMNNDSTFDLEMKNQLRFDTLKNFERYFEDENKYEIFLTLLTNVEEEIKERKERQ